MSQHVYHRRYTCRACCSDDLRSVLDLGSQPLANAFLTDADINPPGKPELRIPLHLMRCARCGLGQLTHVVDPGVLYGPAYPYRSGMSEGWSDHCLALAVEVGFPGALVLDIGCLDGVLLGWFSEGGCTAIGCDPSAPGDDPCTRRELFSSSTRFNHERENPFDVITAQNVFGHVDDARGFLEGIAANLAPTGTAVIECPWIVDLVDKRAWDTIYHEHLSYWGLRSLSRVAAKAGLSVSRVKHFPHLHGGTMRYYLGHREVVQTFDSSMCPVWWAEEDLGDEEWQQFENQSANAIRSWAKYFVAARETGKRVYGYGAAAKLNTLLNSLLERPALNGIFDDTPSKQGKFTPGWHIPVLPPTVVNFSYVDELVVGAPNWKDEIERKARALGFTGEVKVPWDA